MNSLTQISLRSLLVSVTMFIHEIFENLKEVSEKHKKNKVTFMNVIQLHIISKQEILCYLELAYCRIEKAEILCTVVQNYTFRQQGVQESTELSNQDSSTQKTNCSKSQSKPCVIPFSGKAANADEKCLEKNGEIIRKQSTDRKLHQMKQLRGLLYWRLIVLCQDLSSVTPTKARERKARAISHKFSYNQTIQFRYQNSIQRLKVVFERYH